MPDTFLVTIIFIAACTFIGALVKGRSRDRCLKDINGYPVTFRMKDGKLVWGRLHVENTGLELMYDAPYRDKSHEETSYILYKSEYENILAIIRYKDELTEKENIGIAEDLEKTKMPSRVKRLMRNTRNIFGTVRDSLMEIAGLFVGRMKSAMPAGKILEGQDKYITKMQQEGMSVVGTAYEPVLEKYIGKKTVLAVAGPEGKEEYSGILKEYTAAFIEMLDTEHKDADGSIRKADIVVPRSAGVVRHSGSMEAE